MRREKERGGEGGGEKGEGGGGEGGGGGKGGEGREGGEERRVGQNNFAKGGARWTSSSAQSMDGKSRFTNRIGHGLSLVGALGASPAVAASTAQPVHESVPAASGKMTNDTRPVLGAAYPGVSGTGQVENTAPAGERPEICQRRARQCRK